MELSLKRAISIDTINSVLIENFRKIDSVSEWALESGFTSIKRFSQFYKRETGFTPIKILVGFKIILAINLISNKPDISCYEVALEIGKRDERSLNIYFKRHTGQPPSYFRNNSFTNSEMTWKNRGVKLCTKYICEILICDL